MDESNGATSPIARKLVPPANPDRRRESEQKLSQTQQRFGVLIAAMRRSESRMKSLRYALGKHEDMIGLACDCVGFANASGRVV